MWWRALIHLRLGGRSIWRWLAAVPMMFLSAFFFFLWLGYIMTIRKIIVENRDDVDPIEIVAWFTGEVCLYWGVAQALIALGACLLGVDVRSEPTGRWVLPRGYRREWIISVLGSLVFILLILIVLLILASLPLRFEGT